MNHLGDLLGGVGLLHREGEPDEEEKEDEASGNSQLQREGVVDGCGGVGGVDAHRVEQRGRRRGRTRWFKNRVRARVSGIVAFIFLLPGARLCGAEVVSPRKQSERLIGRGDNRQAQAA